MLDTPISTSSNQPQPQSGEAGNTPQPMRQDNPGKHLPFSFPLLAFVGGLLIVLGGGIIIGLQYVHNKQQPSTGASLQQPTARATPPLTLPVKRPPLPTEQPASLRTYTNAQYHYRFSYPAEASVREAAPFSPTQTPDVYVLSTGEVQKVTIVKGSVYGACSITVFPNTQQLTLTQWAQNYHQDAVGGDNLAKLVGDTTIGKQSAKQFDIYLFDHTDTAFAVAHESFIYFIEYARTTTNPNYAVDPDMQQMEGICSKTVLPTFTFLD